MSSLENKTVLVIGQTGGLGAQIAAQLSAAGASVLGASSAEIDLGSEESIRRFGSALVESGRTIDGIVLAAGLVAFGSIAETPAEITDRLMRVNFLGQAALVRELLPMLQQSATAGNEPFIVSISGVISESPMAGLAAYSASKTALLGFATAASRELRRAGIRWIDARPGHTETGLADRAIFGTSPAFGVGLSSQQVASRIVEAIVNDEKDLPSTSFKATDA